MSEQGKVQDREQRIMDEIRKEWHLDRKVIVGIIIALLTNAGSFIWYASKMDYTVQTHEIRLVQNEKELSDMKDKNSTLYERLARIEANQNFQTETLREIKEAIKK